MNSKFKKIVFIFTITSFFHPVFAQRPEKRQFWFQWFEYKARIGIEHEIIFTFDKSLSANQIKSALEPYATTYKPDLNFEGEERGFIAFNFSKEHINEKVRLGFSKGDQIYYLSKQHTVSEVFFDPKSFEVGEKIFVEDGLKNRIQLNSKSFYLETIKFNYEQMHSDVGDVLEFIEPNGEASYTDQNNYLTALKTLEKNEKEYVRILESLMKRAFVAYNRYNLEKVSSYFDRDIIFYAYLHILKETYNLKIAPASFGTIKNYIRATMSYRRPLLYKEKIRQARSFHLSITLPKLRDRDSWEQARYSAYTLQWLEPIFAANFLSGNPHINLQEGTQGSYRMLTNGYSSPGTVPLRVCKPSFPNIVNYCVQESDLNWDRYGFISYNKNCYRSLISSPDNDFYGSGGIDLKGKKASSNVLSYGDGFEFRILENHSLEEFVTDIQVFVLALAHAEESFGRPLDSLEYVNLSTGKETQSLRECGPCSQKNSPCNTWQIAMASVLSRGFRGALNADFIHDLEKNLELKFWNKLLSTHEKAYAFEVADALIEALYKRYHDHRLVKLLLGDDIKEPPRKLRKSLDEWAYYFIDEHQAWHSQWLSLKEEVKNHSGSVISSTDFEMGLLKKYFDQEWINSYDDIMFTLQKEGLVDLRWDNAKITKVCLGCSFK